MKKEIRIKSVACRITEDSYSEGLLNGNSFHSFDLDSNAMQGKTTLDLNSPSFKSDLLEMISDNAFDSPKLTWDDIEFDEINYGCINYSQMVKFMPNVDWQEFYVPSKGEIASWKMGKKKLYTAEYTFSFEIVGLVDMGEIIDQLINTQNNEKTNA